MLCGGQAEGMLTQNLDTSEKTLVFIFWFYHLYYDIKFLKHHFRFKSIFVSFFLIHLQSSFSFSFSLC